MAVAVVAAYFAIHGTLSVGQLITVIGLAQFLIEPFSLLAIVPSWVAEARGVGQPRRQRAGRADTRHEPRPATPTHAGVAPGTLTVRDAHTRRPGRSVARRRAG